MKKQIALTAMLMASMAYGADPATLPDGGFEQVNANKTAFDAWRQNSSAGFDSVEVVRGAQGVRSGDYAVRLIKKDGNAHFYSNDSISIENGTTYTLSYWAMGQGSARAQLYLYKGSKESESFHGGIPLQAAGKNELPDDGQWHEQKFTYTANDAQAISARVVIDVSGSLYVDDVVFGDARSLAATQVAEPAIRPNLVTVGSLATAPVVDGVIQAGEYSIQSAGLLNNKTQDLYRLKNEFHLSRDAERLYFAMRMQLPDGYAFERQGTQRDDAALMAGSDTFYFFLRPDKDVAARGFEGAYVAIGANGTIYDAWEKVDWAKGSVHRDTSFNADWNVKTQSHDGIWTIELSVPLDDVKLDASAADLSALLSFGMKLKDVTVVWQSHPSWFDHYQAFGQLNLGQSSLIAQMPTPGELTRGIVAPQIKLSNSTDEDQPYEINYIISTPKMVGGGVGTVIFDQIVDQRTKDVIRDQAIFNWMPTGSLSAGKSGEEQTTGRLEKTGYFVLEADVRSNGKPISYQKIPFRYMPPVTATLTPVPSKEEIKLAVSLAGAAEEERGKVKVEFLDASGKSALTHEIDSRRDEINDTVSMRDLAPGDYIAKFTLQNTGGNETGTFEQPFKKWETPVWLKEQAGIEALQPEWVPQPWTPVEVNGNEVKVWGRTFTYEKGSLLAGTTSQGQELLTGAARLKYSVAGKERVIDLSAPQFDLQAAGRVVFQQTGTTNGLAAKVTQTIEFDGMNRIDLTLTPKEGGVKVDKIWIEFPIRNRSYTAYFANDGRSWQHGVATDEHFHQPRGYRWLWIGDDSVGLAYFSDNYKGWLINSTKPRVTFTTDGDTRRLDLLLANEPSDVTEPMNLTIGLHATPFKQPFAGWRDLRPDGLGMSPPPTNLVMPHASLWNSADSKPSPRSWESLKDLLEFAHGRGQKVYPYMGAFFIAPYDNISREFPFDKAQERIPEEFLLRSKATATRQEEYFYFAEDWSCYPKYVVEAEWETRQEARTSPSSSWTDYFVHGIEEMLERSSLDGIYLDIQTPMTSFNEEKGHVFVTKDGVREGTAELFATRDFYKRLYRVFEKHRTNDQRPWMLGHSFAANTPYASFWDLNFNGEEIKPTHKFEATPLYVQTNAQGEPMARVTEPGKPMSYVAEGYRSVFGEQFGVPSMVLPQYSYLPELKLNEHSREMLSLTFLHNNLLWPAYIPPQPVYEFWSKVEVPYRLADAEFHAYWKNGTTTSAPYIKASYWKNGDDYLIAIANWSGAEAQATVTLPAELSALKDGVDMESGEAFAIDGKISLPINAHDLRVIRVQVK